MQLLDRFSTHLKTVLTQSIRLATELKNAEVEPLHLFFSLSLQKGSVAAEVIQRFHLEAKQLEPFFSVSPRSMGTKKDVYKIPHSNNPLSPLSALAKAALEKALQVAEASNHNYIGTEHLLSGILEVKDPVLTKIFQANKIKISDVQKQLVTVLSNTSQFPALNEAAEAIEHIQDHMNSDQQIPPSIDQPEITTTEQKKHRKKQSALDFFGLNLTSDEAQASIDPVIGRETEIDRLIHILCRRTKNNPILLGDPGVGKTAIVEGLAKRIFEGTVPELLLNKKVYALDMGMLIAGTIYRGEFEGRLRQVIEDVSQNPDIILFIDEIHNIVGAGSNQGTMDAANMLKPALARGHIRCIGATTPNEFKKYIESDPALERRFQPIFVKEPSSEDAVKIIQGIRPHYEAFHRIAITNDAIEAAVFLAERYISNKFLPDKAIDLIDETAAAKRLTVKNLASDNRASRLKQKLEKTIAAKEEAALNDKFTEAVALKDQEEKLRAELKKLEKEGKTKNIKLLGTISREDVVKQLTAITGTPPAEIFSKDTTALIKLVSALKENIVGQDQVIETVSQLILQAKLGISHPDRPLASFLFVGESGVGKSELAKVITQTLYPAGDALVKLDMSEFNESFGVSKLLGSPAGYVGYKEQNNFTDRIKMNPHCVVLFDEIDKAHKDVTKLLLQMLEQGEITDATGKKISLKHAILILTTSLGSEEAKKKSFGFDSASVSTQNQNQVTEKLKEFFTAELINRLDSICIFNNLSAENLITIAELEIIKLNKRLEKYHTKISYTTENIK
jgi:ATP-dependent Clp protease ATP-binding subunit ClpC